MSEQVNWPGVMTSVFGSPEAVDKGDGTFTRIWRPLDIPGEHDPDMGYLPWTQAPQFTLPWISAADAKRIVAAIRRACALGTRKGRPFHRAHTRKRWGQHA